MHPPREKYRSGTDMSYAIMCTWPTGPCHRAVYTRIYIHVVVDDNRGYPSNTRSYDYRVCSCSYYHPVEQYAVWQPR